MPSVSIVMVEKKFFLPEDIASQLESPFREFITAIGPADSKRAAGIILTMYEDDLELRRKKAPSVYHKVDPALL